MDDIPWKVEKPVRNFSLPYSCLQLQSNESDKYRILYRMVKLCLQLMRVFIFLTPLKLYTLLFFIVVTTILMNIIFGVIIDTFAGEFSSFPHISEVIFAVSELRARKDEIDRDVSGYSSPTHAF